MLMENTVQLENSNNLKYILGLLVSNHSEMDGYISILFLISVALTFDGTEADCRGICKNICEQPEVTSGQNCCRGNSGTYVDGTYDYACKNQLCALGRYMPSRYNAS